MTVASSKGHEKMVQFLLSRGAKVNANGGNDGNALMAASLNGFETIIHLLLDKGADVNAICKIHYGTAL